MSCISFTEEFKQQEERKRKEEEEKKKQEAMQKEMEAMKLKEEENNKTNAEGSEVKDTSGAGDCAGGCCDKVKQENTDSENKDFSSGEVNES